MLPLLLRFAGLCHIGLICAGALVPRVTRLRHHIAGLPPFLRQLFWVYYAFIGLCLVSFGLASLLLAEDLAGGTPLARAVCGFFAVFWSLRLWVALRIFDVSPYLTRPSLRMGYALTNIVFAFLPPVYLFAAIHGFPHAL